MTNFEKAVDELWMAVSEIMVALRDVGADEGAMATAVEHLNNAHEFIGGKQEGNA